MRNTLQRLIIFFTVAAVCTIWPLIGAAVERVSPDLPPVYSDLIQKRAIRGYDPVAYFTDNKAVEGKEEFTHEWKGAKWYFASAEHRDMFAADPEKYAPVYGGWCAYAMSQGVALSIDPNSWTIYEGKLYLNAKTAYTRFLGDIPGYVEKANEHWKVVEPD